MALTFQEQVAVVTGAGKGIGRCTALALMREGAHVVAISRTGADLASLEQDAKESGGRVTAIEADISDESSVQRAAELTADACGKGIDILVNNAGLYRPSSVGSMDSETWDAVVSTNLTGTFLVTRAFLPLMIKRGKGSIIIVSSTSGKRGDAGGAAYSASKFGLAGFAESLTREVRSHNIRVTTVYPSHVDTRPVPAGSVPLEGKGVHMRVEDLVEAMLSVLRLPHRTMVREIELWATNP